MAGNERGAGGVPPGMVLCLMALTATPGVELRGLNVMATPSVVEIADGVIVGFHVGVVPAEVMARFAR